MLLVFDKKLSMLLIVKRNFNFQENRFKRITHPREGETERVKNKVERDPSRLIKCGNERPCSLPIPETYESPCRIMAVD